MEVIRDLEYSRPDGLALHLDLYLPGTRPAPVVMWVPGGGWGHCKRESVPLVLLEHSFAMASVSYRTTAQATAPANIHDCRAAVDWLRANASRYGLDARRVGAWGSSAGGHLVAMLATMPGLLQAACVFCAPTDLVQEHPIIEAYLGGPLRERRALAASVSPRRHVTRNCPPILIVHGEKDTTVPVSESREFYAALQRVGATSTLHVLPEVGHGWEAKLSDEIVVSFFKAKLGPAQSGMES